MHDASRYLIDVEDVTLTAVFSHYFMVASDRTEPDPRPERRAPRTSRSQKAVADALGKALAAALPDDAGIWTQSAPEVSALAAAFADIVVGRSVVLRLAPDMAGARRNAVQSFLDTVMRVSGAVGEQRQEAAIARLADVLLPDDLAQARGPVAADNLALRDRFIVDTAPLTSAEVAAAAGHSAGNRYATAARWKKVGEIFSVHHRGGEYFPAFQFRDGRPHPTIKKALAAQPAHLSPWQRAFWFVSTNGWLRGAAPAECLDDPDAVVAAARREAEDLIG